MDNEFNSVPLDTCSDLISRAFGGSKLSPYSDLSSLYEYPKAYSMLEREYVNSNESSMVNTARSTYSSMVSVETTHVDNAYTFAWSDSAEGNTPRQITHSNNVDEQDAKLLKVIKTLFTQSMVDVFRKYVDELFKRDSKTMPIQPDTEKINLDIDAMRTRVFAVLRKCLTNNTEINIVHIIETIREKYDTTLIEEIPSFGSITHSNGYCKPCVFANKTVNSCKNGVECNFCHFKHRITRRKNTAKEAQDLVKQRKDAAYKEQQTALATASLELHGYLSSHKNNRQTTQSVDDKDFFNFAAAKFSRSAEDYFNASTANDAKGDSPFSNLASNIEAKDKLEDALIAKCVEFLEKKYNAQGKRRTDAPNMIIGQFAGGEPHVRDSHSRSPRLVHLCILLLTVTSLALYTSTSDFSEDSSLLLRPRAPPFRLTELSLPSIKVYLHPALTLPRTNFQLPDLAKNINIEASRILGIEKNTTLNWSSDTESALNLAPSLNIYGLTGIYVHVDNNTQVFTALLRMPIETCRGQMLSWTCQRDDKHAVYDNTHCVVVLQAGGLQSLLIAARDAHKTQSIALTDTQVKGAFCGNPLLQRIAAGDKAVYLLNHKLDTDDAENDYLLCKYSIENREMSQCFDIEARNETFNMPLALIYIRHTDTVLVVHYKTEEYLNAIAFDGQALDFKVIFRPLTSNSGFIIYTDSYGGNVIFHGDLPLYEVDTVLNMESGSDLTMGML
ncbi:uncharacterized protein BXIN_2443 [Babesia sp. Xinjiang]|uniref:uncharacterized protein n=1 Tax=Babesia sp. Xinjiang TaxID=462227 RepID=UPI000A255C93|nr:uncharacterized protein BXIN_2443 [Babesia sp. Xinjiang]ORM41525.1 hypothetical protein BXIN_2443 [Babesia sp. Xinjiang]